MATLGAVLVTGGPGSGKTEEIVARLAARYKANPLYEAIALAPTSRHGDQLRKRLVSRCGVALRLRVETIHRFSQSLASAGEKVSGTVAEELLAAVARREIQSGAAAYFRPIAHTDGLIDLLSAAVGDLLSEDVEPEALLEAARRAGDALPDGAELHLRVLLLGAGPPGLATPGQDATGCGRRLGGGRAAPGVRRG